MDQETSIWIKKEGTDEDLKDPLSMVQLYQSSLNIKEESKEDVFQEPLEDPLNIEERSLHVKQDTELKQHVDSFEHKFVEDPLGTSCFTDCLKEDPELHLEEHETENIPLEDRLSIHVKQDTEFKQHLDSFEHKFVEDSLGISWSTDNLKEDPELQLEEDGTENYVLSSTSYEFSSARLIQSTGGSCGVSLEETVNQGVVSNGLEIGVEESANFTMCNTYTQRWTSEEKSLFNSNLKCSLQEKEFHKFSCSSCLQIFSSKYSLMKHVFIHIEGVQPPLYVRKSCGEVFPSNIRLNQHFKYVGGDTPKSDHKCDVCGKSFTKLSRLKMHKLIHTGLKPHKCGVCGKSFSVLGSLKRHSSIHTGIRPHTCDVCGKQFTMLSHLKMHKFIHIGIQPPKCDVCGKSFPESSLLNKYKLIHTGLKPHKCDVCGKSFIWLGDLKKHKVIHIGLKPHKCDVCGKLFARLSGLQIHTLTHTGRRPHTCNVCDKSFTHLSTLKTHALLHTGMRQHTCDVCGKSFTLLGQLKRHSRIHTGSRPHTCDTCGKPFTRSCSLKRHALIHTGKRPHTCVVCGKSFSQLGGLKRHTAIHTGKNSP